MKLRKNTRGFLYAEFKDANGMECSVQESSAMEEPHLWLGIDEVAPKLFVPGVGWRAVQIDVPPGATLMVAGRMHLTKDTAKELLSYLSRFVATGQIGSRRRKSK